MGKRKRKASQSHVIVGGSTSGNGKSCNTRRQVEAQNQNRSLEVGRQIDVIDHQKDDIDSQSDVIDRLAEGNDEIDHRQRSKISEFYKLEQKTKGLEKRLSESREKIKALEAQNTAYKDDLFRYQPATQLSESEISQRYENLSDRILAWVDHEIRQFDEEWKAIYGEYPPNCLLFSCDQRIPKGAYFLETYSEHGGEFLLRSAIHCLLQRKLFDNEDVLFAVSGKEEDLLEAIEQGMEKLEQNKDRSWIRNWRSLALRSLAVSNMYMRQCEIHSIGVARRVFEALFPFLSFLEEDDSAFGRFYDQVFSVAVRLANDIKSSSAYYGYSQDITKGPVFERKRISRKLAENMIMINLKTGKIVNNKPPEIVVERILLIAPALMRRAPGKNRKWLSKEIVGVEVHSAKPSPSVYVQVPEAIIIDDSDVDNATVASLDASLITHHKADTAVDLDHAMKISLEASLSGSRKPNTTVNMKNTTEISPDVA